ncbi:NADH:flavin oxidoreductase [Cetobacterium ceti]
MKDLFKNVKINNLDIKNAFVRSATWENLTEDGHINARLLKIYEELAEGEIGLILTGYANIVKEEQPNAGMFGIYDDSFIDGYKQLTEVIHKYNSKIFLQVAYGGTKTTYNLGERIIFAPSDIPERGTGTQGKPMTKEEIDYIVEAFGESARRAKEANFDGIEIHGAHTYLIGQFLSPYYNKREDEYGGSLENRMKFLIEVYQSMRNKVGKEYPIIVKLTASEFFDGGLTFEETKLICKKMEEIGIDGIEISGNIHGKGESLIGKEFDGFILKNEGYFSEYAKEIAKICQIPIITVGGIKTFEGAQEIIDNSEISMIGISRPLLAEPKLIKKWKNGNREKVKCIRCSKCRNKDGNYCIFK